MTPTNKESDITKATQREHSEHTPRKRRIEHWNNVPEGCSCQVIECIPLHRHQIQHCPLHAAAPELLKLLKATLEQIRESRTITLDLGTRIQSGIAKAENR